MRHQNYRSLPPDLRLLRLKERGRKASATRRALVYAMKAGPCHDCERRYPHYVMDFDHPPGALKTIAISALMTRASLQKVREEVARCDLVCSNCHRLRTSKRQASPRPTKRRLLLSVLKAAPCTDCASSYPPCVMDFDHRPGTVKLGSVSHLRADLILEEIKKCDLVCSNCHRKRTRQRRGDSPWGVEIEEVLR